MSIQAIETEYNGYKFRSRLEARWAVFFDALGIRYEYEKEGYQLSNITYENQYGYRTVMPGDVYYLPDFFLPDRDVWIEIKGDKCSDDDMNKAIRLHKSSGKTVCIAEGSIGDHSWTVLHENEYEPAFTVPVKTEQAHAIALMFEEQSDDTSADEDWGLTVHCPICGYDYVHTGEMSSKSSDDYSAWQGRGSADRLDMWCENGHYWTVRFGFHKGMTFIAVENMRSGSDDTGIWLANGDRERLTSAIAVARTARFEHGETPKVLRGKPRTK